MLTCGSYCFRDSTIALFTLGNTLHKEATPKLLFSNSEQLTQMKLPMYTYVNAINLFKLMIEPIITLYCDDVTKRVLRLQITISIPPMML